MEYSELFTTLVTVLKQSDGARDAEKDQAAAQALRISLNEADHSREIQVSVSSHVKYIILR